MKYQPVLTIIAAALLFVQIAPAQSLMSASGRGSGFISQISQQKSNRDSVYDVTRTVEVLPNVWGLDILISNDGFGLGTFFKRHFTPDLSGFVSFSISESKDEREFDVIDPFTQTSFTPGKLNRFLVMPLMFGVQYRLFREDIADNFRPFINAGVGPTLIFVAPFTELSSRADGSVRATEVEFFKSLGRGRAHYTLGSFIGAGANFGSDNTSVVGVNFRYYFTYPLKDGIPSLYNFRNGDVASTKKEFGGFFITLNFGLAF